MNQGAFGTEENGFASDVRRVGEFAWVESGCCVFVQCLQRIRVGNTVGGPLAGEGHNRAVGSKAQFFDRRVRPGPCLANPVDIGQSDGIVNAEVKTPWGGRFQSRGHLPVGKAVERVGVETVAVDAGFSGENEIAAARNREIRFAQFQFRKEVFLVDQDFEIAFRVCLSGQPEAWSGIVFARGFGQDDQVSCRSRIEVRHGFFRNKGVFPFGAAVSGDGHRYQPRFSRNPEPALPPDDLFQRQGGEFLVHGVFDLRPRVCLKVVEPEPVAFRARHQPFSVVRYGGAGQLPFFDRRCPRADEPRVAFENFPSALFPDGRAPFFVHRPEGADIGAFVLEVGERIGPAFGSDDFEFRIDSVRGRKRPLHFPNPGFGIVCVERAVRKIDVDFVFGREKACRACFVFFQGIVEVFQFSSVGDRFHDGRVPKTFSGKMAGPFEHAVKKQSRNR